MIFREHIPKRKVKKPTAAQRQLASDWEALMKKYEPKKPLSTKRVIAKSIVVNEQYVRETQKIPSMVTPGSSTSKKEIPKYTGDKMLGIGTLHKSNAVPVFSSDDAKEIARMRRG